MSLRNENEAFLRSISSYVREIDYRQQTADALLREAKRELGSDNPVFLEEHFPTSLIFRDYQREIRAVHDNAQAMHSETAAFWISVTSRFGGTFSQKTPWELADDVAAMAKYESGFYELRALFAPRRLRARDYHFFGLVCFSSWSPETHLRQQTGVSLFDAVTRACVQTLLFVAKTPKRKGNRAKAVYEKLDGYILLYLVAVCVGRDIWKDLRNLAFCETRPSLLFT